MLNQERKDYYLEELGQSGDIGEAGMRNVRRIFDLAGSYEDRIDKDICNWNIGEITEYFKYLDRAVSSTLYNHRSQLSAYTSWCIRNNLSDINQNNFLSIKNDLMEQCVNQARNKTQIITHDELIQTLDSSSLKNPCDKFLILGLFEGMGGYGNNLEELINAKMEDINGNEIKLCTGRTLKISDKLIEYAKESYCEEYYYSFSQLVKKKKDGFALKRKDPDWDTIMGRPYRTNESKSEMADYTRTNNRFHKAIKEIHINIPSPNRFILIGRYDFIIRNSKANGISPMEYIEKNADLIDSIYGKLSLVSQKQFEKQLESVNTMEF